MLDNIRLIVLFGMTAFKPVFQNSIFKNQPKLWINIAFVNLATDKKNKTDF